MCIRDRSKTSPLAPFSFDRREPNPDDVVLSIDYCGICHSDIHQVRGEWGRELYPMVPGHEIVGHVTAIGSNVHKFKVGDRAAVGVIVESCMHCENCKADLEVYCTDGGARDTYNACLLYTSTHRIRSRSARRVQDRRRLVKKDN